MPERETEGIQTTVERRLSPRARRYGAHRLRDGRRDVLGVHRNINEGGLFIESETLLALDEQVQLQFRLPGVDDPIKVSGRVAWIREAGVEGLPEWASSSRTWMRTPACGSTRSSRRFASIVSGPDRLTRSPLRLLRLAARPAAAARRAC